MSTADPRGTAGRDGAGLRAMSSLSRCMSVRAIVRGSSAGEVELELGAAPACRGCEGACLWRRLPGATRARLPAAAQFAAGDSVLLSLPDRHVLAGSVVLHGLPWAALLGGAFAGHLTSGTDLGAFVGALAGVVGAVAAGRGLRARLERWLLGRLVITAADA